MRNGVWVASPQHIDLAIPGSPQKLNKIMEGYHRDHGPFAFAMSGGFFNTKEGARTAHSPVATNAYGLLVRNGLVVMTGYQERPVFLIRREEDGTTVPQITKVRPSLDEKGKQALKVAVEGGPLLLWKGNETDIQVEIVAGEFTGLQPSVRRARAGIGIRMVDHEPQVVAVVLSSATLFELRDYMKAHGCRYAMALDGGNSVGTYELGKDRPALGSWSRSLPAGIVFLELIEGGDTPFCQDLPIQDDFIPKGRRNRPEHKFPTNSYDFITIHDTANSNRGANALNHGLYLKGDSAASIPVSWHFTVDDTRIVQHLPVDEVGWHAGDGAQGMGNRQSIGIEICENSDGDREKAEDLAARLTAYLLGDRPLSAVVQHNRWNNKNCPRVLRTTGRWNQFLAKVQEYREEVSLPPEGSSVPPEKMPVLRRGATGLSVRTLQERLQLHGYEIDVDGSFGPLTDSVVRRFQADKNLVVDGSVGPATWTELMKDPDSGDYWRNRALTAESELASVKGDYASALGKLEQIRKAGGWK